MPLSGGYYFPVMQSPASSYPSLDLRGLGAAPDTAAGLGRIYVMSGSGDLFYKDPSGNEIFLGSEVSSSAGYVTGSTNFFVTNTLQVSGVINNSVGHLVLSSSAGSRVTVSGSSLMLSMAGTIGTAAGALTVQGAAGMILNSSIVTLGAASANGVVLTTNGGHLIMSASSATGGTIVAFSSSANFVNKDKPWHINAVNSHLILSSSTGSVIKISGALCPNTVATANLLAGTDSITGSILWDTTTKTLKIYGAEGWCPVLTGAAG